MREILFRGKTLNGVWVYGDLLNGGYDYDTAIREKHNKTVIRVFPETVGQFTGLTDKNGKKIFEGDIVKLKDGSTCVVRYGRHDLWCCGCCFDSHESVGFYLDEGDGSAYSDDNAWGLVEVIGNIHDNPELMEVTE